MPYIEIDTSRILRACVFGLATFALPVARAQVEKDPTLNLIVRIHDGTGAALGDSDRVHIKFESIHNDDGSDIERDARGSVQRFDGLPASGYLKVTDFISGVLKNKPLEQIVGSSPPVFYLNFSQASGRLPGECIGTDFLPANLSLDTGNSVLAMQADQLTLTGDVMLLPCRHALQLANWDDLNSRFPLIAAILTRVASGVDARSHYETMQKEHPYELGNLLNILYLLSITSIQSQPAIKSVQAVDWSQPQTASAFTVQVLPGTLDALKAVSHKSPEAMLFHTDDPDWLITVLGQTKTTSQSNGNPTKAFDVTWKEAPPQEITLSESQFTDYLYQGMWNDSRIPGKQYSPPFTVVRRTQLSGIEAANDSDLPQLQAYLETGGDPNAVDPESRATLLEIATSNQRIDMVKLLLDHGVNSQSMVPALIASCTNGSLEIATRLLARVTALTAPITPSPIGSCLSEAVKNERLSILNLLLNYGAHDLIVGSQGDRMMIDAAGLASPDIADFLLKQGASARSTTASGSSALAVAAANNAEITQLLLDHGADPNENSGEPLRTACAHDKPAVVRILLGRGASPNSSSPLVPPLVDAAYAGFSEVVSALLDAKADPNAKNSQGYTALIMACLHGQLEIITDLIAHNADVNLASTDGATPLLAAAEEGSKESIAILLAKGARTAVHFNGMTPLQIAQKRKNNDAIQLLGGHPKPINEAEIHGMVEDMSVTWPIDRLNHLHSLLFQDAFLLKSHDVENAPLGLTDLQLSILRGQLQIVLSSITTKLSQRKDFLVARIGRPVDDNFPVKVDVIDSSEAGAWTTPPATECGPPETNAAHATAVTCITIDAKLLRADLVASLSQIRPELSRLTSEQQYDAVLEQRRWLRDSIDDMGWDPHLPINPEAQSTKEHFDSWPSTGDLELQYYGTLLFLISHELGHAALGHLVKPPASCTDRELQADQFAAALVGDSFVAKSVIYIGVPFFSEDRLLQYAGWFTFFNGTYEHLGITNNPNQNQTCQYPDRNLRIDAAMTEFKYIAGHDAQQLVVQLRQREGKGYQGLLESWAFASYASH